MMDSGRWPPVERGTMSEKRKWIWRAVDALNADNTDRGYGQGFGDGEQGRRAKPADYRHLRPFNFVWGFPHAAQTYSQGYRTGYTDGSRKRVGLFETNTSAGQGASSDKGVSAMSSEDSYQRQLRLLENLGRQLEALDNAIRTSTENYKRQIERAAAQGFMTNYTNQLEIRYQEFLRHTERLQEVVERNRQLLLRHEDVISGRMKVADS